MVSGGNLPALRTAMKPLPKWAAMAGPNRNPRDSRPAMESNSLGDTGRASSSALSRIFKPLGSASTGMKSRKMMPSLGNPGTERTKDTRYSASCCPTLLNASMVMSDCAIVLAPFMPLRCDTRMVLPNRTAYFVLVSLSSPVSSAVSSSDTTDASIGT